MQFLPPYVVCPECKGPLLVKEALVQCQGCDATYPRQNSLVKFSPQIEDDFKRKQAHTFDGDAALSYVSLTQYRELVRALVARVNHCGLGGGSLKDVKNRELFDRLELRPGAHILDIGSGSGFTLNTLHLIYGVKGTGVDIAPLAVRRCWEVNPCGNDYYIGDAEKLPFADETFDCAVTLDVLEHLPNPQRCLEEATRVLKPGANLLIYAISRKDNYTWHWAMRKLTEGVMGIDTAGGHDKSRFIAPDEASAWAQQSGLLVRSLAPFHGLFTLIVDECFLNTEAVRFIAARPRLWRALLLWCEWVDRPIVARGFGNGFYLLAQRPY